MREMQPFEQYEAFGIEFRSQVAFPRACLRSESRAGSNAAVEVRYGRVPLSTTTTAGNDASFEAIPGEFILRIPSVASYWVRDGRSIVVEPCPGSSDSDVQLFLLGSAVGALLQLRRYMVLHASAISSPRGAVLFCGASGAGKSTLAAAMVARGYPLIADDIAAIRLNDGGAWIEAGPPHIKLWRDVIDALYTGHRSFVSIRSQVDKYFVPAKTSVRDAQPIFRVYQLSTSDRQDIELQPLRGALKLHCFAEHSYRAQFLRGLGLAGRHLRHLVALSKRVSAATLYRPAGRSNPQAVADFIANDLAESNL